MSQCNSRWVVFQIYKVTTTPATPATRYQKATPAKKNYSFAASKGPWYLSDPDTFQLLISTRINQGSLSSAPSTWGSGASVKPVYEIYRMVYEPAKQVWVWDLRSDSALAMCSSLPGDAIAGEKIGLSGDDLNDWSITTRNGYDKAPIFDLTSHGHVPLSAAQVGATALKPALRGKWPGSDLPPTITVNGHHFRRAGWHWPYPGVRAQYREAVVRGSRHLFVLENGTWVVPHIDAENPDLGNPAKHFVEDVLRAPAPSV